MADCTENVRLGMVGKELSEKVSKSKILVVGAGGIGCELLKNLVLTGFKDLEVVCFCENSPVFILTFQSLIDSLNKNSSNF